MRVSASRFAFFTWWLGLVVFGTAGVARAAGDGTPEPDRVLTLEQSVQTGLQNSQALLSARDDVRIAQQRIVEARSLYFPTLALNMNASRYRANDPVVLPGDFGSTVLVPSSEPENFYAGRLGLRQMIYNGGRNQMNLRLAEAALEQARLREEEIRGQVTADGVQAFFDVLLAQKRLALTQETERTLAARAEIVRPGDELARGTLDVLRTRLRRERAERRREEERATLAFLSAVGLELYTRVGMSGELETTPVREPLPKLLARAQEVRLEIRGTEYQREIDRLAVNLTESERNPVVAFGAAYELNNDSFPLDRSFWNATLNVNLPIFDGFASRARIRQTRLLADQSRISRASVEDRINREVRETYGDVLFWQSEIENRKADLDRISDLVTRLGAGRNAAERAPMLSELLAAEEAYWESIHGHRVARARLEKAVGLPLAP
ncbi:MAG: TolC family protein [Elusimicrobia bacterium]|nr:TolC family protein [Elusimicrobiota bacterium]